MQNRHFNISDYCNRMEEHLGGQEGEAQLFWKAFSYAVYAHEEQKRKSGEAYVSHPCKVAQILIEELGVKDPQTLAAAVLHDTVEDVPEVTSEIIGSIFGKNVEEIVDGCTKITNFSGDKQTFYKLVHRKLFSGAATHIEIILVKLADRLHNLRTLASMPKHKQQKIAEETLDIYAPMAKVLGLFKLKRELYDLALQYKFPRQAQKLMAKLRHYEEETEVQEIIFTLRKALEEVWISADVGLRIKGLWAYFDPLNKLLNKEIETPMEILIAADDEQTCYRILGIVNQNFPPIPRTIRDFIANPKATGYRSIHARANIKGIKYLIKIRTHKILESGRSGIIRDWSKKRQVPGNFEKEIKEMFDILGTDNDVSYREMIAASGKKEIYTYTPNGDPIYLPNNSIVLDFAFKVHTEVGSHCRHAMIGGKIYGPDHVLQDGDRVRIITRKKTVTFDPDIQELCQTPKARSELSKLFRRRRHALAEKIGQSLLGQELKRYGMPPQLLFNHNVDLVLEHFQVKDLDELFQSIGTGRLRLDEVVREMQKDLYADKITLMPPTGTLNRIFLDSLDPVSIKLSRCCNPIPSEKGLYGLLSERGLSIHSKDCSKFRSLKIQREEVIEIRWHLKETKVKKEQSLLFLKPTPRNRLLMMLGVAPDDMKINEVISLSRRPAKLSPWEIKFSVDNLQGLKNILNHFKKSGLPFDFELDQ